MVEAYTLKDVKGTAREIERELDCLPLQNTPNLRRVRLKYSQRLRRADPNFVLALARQFVKTHRHRWIAYEMIRSHRGAFKKVDGALLEELGKGMNSWWSVDAFARTLSGPAWFSGQVPDKLILRWARSKNRWWRRAALVSTVALNVRSHGGHGDVARTLNICRLLVADRDDMVVKAMSWALRELVIHNPETVANFLKKHDRILGSRVKYEVRNKLRTGLKNPRKRRI